MTEQLDLVIGLASPAAILAVVNLLKKTFHLGKWAALVAVVLGVLFSMAEFQFAGIGLYEAARAGLILGLAAAGLFDVAGAIGKPVQVDVPTGDVVIAAAEDPTDDSQRPLT